MEKILLRALIEEYLILLSKADAAESEKEKDHQLALLKMKLEGLDKMLKEIVN